MSKKTPGNDWYENERNIVRENDDFSLDHIEDGESATLPKHEHQLTIPPTTHNQIRVIIATIRPHWTLLEETIYRLRYETTPAYTVREVALITGQARSTVSDTEHRLLRHIKTLISGQDADI